MLLAGAIILAGVAAYLIKSFNKKEFPFERKNDLYDEIEKIGE